VIKVSAKFNIIAFTNSVIDLNWLFRVVQKKGCKANLNKIESIENWDFDDLQIHACEGGSEAIMRQVEEGRIILIGGELNTIKFVVMLSKIKNIYETRFSLDTKEFVYLDSDLLDEVTRPIYDEISHILLSSEMATNLLVSALGAEAIVDYCDDYNKISLNSYNVVRWVFGRQEANNKLILKGYKQVNADVWDRAK
jgi:hypothetical protein